MRRRGRRPAAPRPHLVSALCAIAGTGLGVVIAMGVEAESAGSLAAAGGWATAAGRLLGLVAMYAMVVLVLLVARVPGLERAVGQDRLVGWHRTLGPWPLYLVTAHGALITVGYAQAARDGLLHQLGQLLWTYPGILAATVAFALLITAGVTSYRKARRRMAYETWWSVHLYTYLALVLSFSHQVGTGASFVGHPTAVLFWKALLWGSLAVIVVCRVALPVARSLRHRITVVGATAVGPGTVSVLLAGRDLDRLPVAGGQFLQWRFLRPGLWWQAHPYSLSAVPTSRHLRITVKDLGDHSAGLAALKPGTRVAIEGPYGVFTADHRHGDKVLLVGAGVGSTPIRALLQDLPEDVDAEVVLRASTREGLILGEELRDELRHRRGRMHTLVGSREDVRVDTRTLRELVPDVSERDVYVCGPDGFMQGVLAAARAAGVPEHRLHHEAFDF